jgi:hypothetical protein
LTVGCFEPARSVPLSKRFYGLGDAALYAGDCLEILPGFSDPGRRLAAANAVKTNSPLRMRGPCAAGKTQRGRDLREGPAVSVDDDRAAAMLLALLGRVVVRLAQRDEVLGIEEQARVAAVRLGVVDDRRDGCAAHYAAEPTVRLAAELADAQ